MATAQAKVILCCREPVSRAFSMYRFISRIHGRREFGRSFREVYDWNLQLSEASPVWSQMRAIAKDIEQAAFSVRLETKALLLSFIASFLSTKVLEYQLRKSGDFLGDFLKIGIVLSSAAPCCVVAITLTSTGRSRDLEKICIWSDSL